MTPFTPWVPHGHLHPSCSWKLAYRKLWLLSNVRQTHTHTQLKLTTIRPMVDYFLHKSQTLRVQQPTLMDTTTQGAQHSSLPHHSASQERWRAYDSEILTLVIKSFTTKMAPIVQFDSIFLQSLLRLLDTVHFYGGGVSPQEVALRQVKCLC